MKRVGCHAAKQALIVVVATLLLAGCGSTEDGSREFAPAQGDASAERVDRCADRFMRGVQVSEADEALTRRYVERTYCERFASRGWVYADGALRIAAHEWLEAGYECETEAVDGSTTAGECEELGPGEEGVLECAILRHVRRSEVQAYVAEIRRERGEIACDDGTPPAELGVP